MVAKLIVEEGDLKGSTFNLEKKRDRWVIGSDPEECQLVLNNPSISLQHALISRIPEGLLIENLSQTNPTRINEEEMGLLPRLLEEGDLIQIGEESLRYYDSKDFESYLNQEEETEMATPEQTVEAETEIEKSVEAETEIEESPTPLPSPAYEEPSESEEAFVEEEIEPPALAKINFGLVEAGRWLLKVVNGPNTGAEFYMEAGRSYVLGTDPHHSDVIFHDKSVSRQHVRITITPEDTLFIEDLQSRNGVLMGDVRIEGKQPLPINTIISLGTTSFAVYDREGEMHTIISPLLPSLLKSIQKEAVKEQKGEAKKEESVPSRPATPVAPSPAKPLQPKSAFNFNSFLILLTVIGLVALAGIGMSSLFRSQPVELAEQVNMNELLQHAFQPFPGIHYTFNPANGNLLLVGHLSTPAEKNVLFSRLQNINSYIKSVDDSKIIIDEYVWREMNAILADNPAWKDISVHSPQAGQFVVSGFLKTEKQAEQLSSYLSLNFPYPDLLKKDIVVEANVLHHVQQVLQNYHLSQVSAEITNGQVLLTGHAQENQSQEIEQAVSDLKQLPGVRLLSNKIQFSAQAAEVGMINISDRYHVSGESRIGDKYTVVINGRIVSEGDTLDGMDIQKITADHVFLKNAEGEYVIDY